MSGRILIGSHSVTHPRLSDLEESDAIYEIEESRRQLGDLLGRDVTMFSLPYGASSDSIIDHCKNAGYSRVFTNEPVLAFGRSAEFTTGRVSVNPDEWKLEFRLKLAGAYRWLPLAFATKRVVRKVLRIPHEDVGRRHADKHRSSFPVEPRRD
jgi:peptidoglycan/xylan/chitin deacetylase (PgdA/CDA1 family)